MNMKWSIREHGGAVHITCTARAAQCKIKLCYQADGQDCRIVTPDGRVVGTCRIDIGEPAPAPQPTYTDADRRLAAARAAVCRDCDRCKGVTLTVKGREVYRVRCKDCGCGGLSLVRGDCPLRRWPQTPA